MQHTRTGNFPKRLKLTLGNILLRMPHRKGKIHMTLNELHIKLEILGIPENRYYLHGLYGLTNDDDKMALIMKHGKYSIEYEVYFKEKGGKHSSKIFRTEDDACQYIYKHLKETKEIEDKYSK